MADPPPPSATRPLISSLPYLPGLDGVRALAVVAVMLYHANHDWLSGGFLGVEVFFVISGYLITMLIIGEHERTGRVDILAFWGRRFRRLLPAVFVLLVAMMIYMALFARTPLGRTRGDFVAGVTYSSNFYQIFVGQGYTASEAFVPLRHLWSLAVEEQFYLVWPFVMTLLLRRGVRHLPRIGLYLAGIASALSVVVGVLFVGGDVDTVCKPGGAGYWHVFGRCVSVDETLYLSTFSRAGGLLLGAAFATVWRPRALMRGPMRKHGRLLDLVAVGGLVALYVLVTRLHLSGDGHAFGIRFSPWLFRGGLFFTGVAALMLIAAVTHQRSFAGRLLGIGPLRWIGRRSYGLYLFHWPIYQIIRQQAGRSLSLAQFVLAMVITVPVTEASYRFIESPIRSGRVTAAAVARLPRNSAVFARRRRVAGASVVLAGLLGFAGVSLVTAANRCVGDVECSIARAESAVVTLAPLPVTAAPPSDTDPPSTDPRNPTNTNPAHGAAPGTDATTSTSTSTTTTTTTPVDQRLPLAVGESVMLGAIAQLNAGGILVDAQKSRQGAEMADALSTLRASGLVGRTVIIQIGTNGSISQQVLDRIMAQLPKDQSPSVFFLTVRAPRGWIAANNDLIRALPSRYPWVTVVDWEGLSQQIKICGDGIHVACNSHQGQFYANMIFTAIGRADLVQPLPTAPVTTPPPTPTTAPEPPPSSTTPAPPPGSTTPAPPPSSTTPAPAPPLTSTTLSPDTTVRPTLTT